MQSGRDHELVGRCSLLQERKPVHNGFLIADEVRRHCPVSYTHLERQIQRIEEDLVCACGEKVRAYAQSAFKERLVLCAESLDTSIHAIDLHLERRAGEHITNFGLRDDPST